MLKREQVNITWHVFNIHHPMVTYFQKPGNKDSLMLCFDIILRVHIHLQKSIMVLTKQVL